MSQHTVRFRKRMIRRQHDFNNSPKKSSDESFLIQNNQQQQQQHHRNGYVRKKPDGLICSICQGPAHGYNFDAITCESCKAFFRRNALRPDGKLKCRASDGQCVITITTRKRCKSCRLAKCFEKGMRADWILTDEERLNKKRKIEENRRLRQMLYPDSADSDECSQSSYIDLKSEPLESEDIGISPSTFPSLLSSEDLIKIEQIQQAYSDSVRLTSLPAQLSLYPHTAPINAPWEMANLPINIQSTRLITYLKLIPEFSSLNEHDKLILIKYNTFTLVFIRSVLVYDPIADTYHENGTDDSVFSGKDMIQCFSLHQYKESTRCVRQLCDASQNDHLLIQILLVIMVLSKGSSICTFIDEVEPISQDISSIYHAQNIFVDLLWKYCENKFGYRKTVIIWLKLITASIDAHVQASSTRTYYARNDIVSDQLVPLMKSVMLIV